MSRWAVLISLASLAVASAALAQQDCFGPGDLDSNGTVDLDDYTVFRACLAGPNVGSPPPGCQAGEFARADLDGDGDVDLGDSAAFSASFQRQYFIYGPHRANLEAEMLAMDVAGTLRAPEAEYNRVLRDLQLIRAVYAQLTTVIDDPDYAPDQLIVKLLAGQPTEGYEALNAYYVVVNEEVYSWGRVLTFCDNLNAPVLASSYEALREVDYADPNYSIGGDDQITIAVLGTTYRYTIDDGFLDCFDGCDCHRVWEIDVDQAGTVTLISYNEWGMPWCVF